ncbi:Glucan endo-1,3-beta-glucosidase, basic isoform-like protein [Drosera capensis]
MNMLRCSCSATPLPKSVPPTSTRTEVLKRKMELLSRISSNDGRYPMVITALVVGLLISNLAKTANAIGTCYGMLGNNLPSPQRVVSQYNQFNIKGMRIYGPVSSLSEALQGSSIEVMVGVPNENLPGIASSQSTADSWVQNNVRNYPGVKWKYISAGNEIRPNLDNGGAQYARFVLPAMQNLQNSVNKFGLGIKVSIALETGICINTYPPSKGQFDPSISNYILPIVKFLVSNGSPLFLNAYPYFAYIYTPNMDIRYALFTSPNVVVQDGRYGYQNLFDAIVDSVYSALEKAGAGGVQIVVTETGWPTAGDKATSIANAQTYNNNLIQHVKNGTPKRPGQAIETFIFDMYNENLKSPEREKHWGLFKSTGAQKYPVNFN